MKNENKEKAWTHIKVRPSTKKKLEDAKNIREETYDDLLNYYHDKFIDKKGAENE